MDKEVYFTIFNKITEVIEALKALQCEREETYISAKED